MTRVLRRRSLWVWIPVTLLWSAVTVGSLGGAAVSTVLPQIRTLRFVTTVGEILASRVEREGKSRTLKLRYSYEVAGQAYEGTRRTFSSDSESSGWPDKLARDLSVGAAVIVHYDPANPTEAVLVPGLLGDHLFMLQFTTPFVLIMVMMWATVIQIARGCPIPLSRHERVVRSGQMETIYLPATDPFMGGVLAFGLAAFLGMFPLFIFTPLTHSLPAMAAVWLGLVAAGLGFASRLWLKRQQGWGQLRLDLVQRVLTLPRTSNRAPGVSVRFEEVASVVIIQGGLNSSVPKENLLHGVRLVVPQLNPPELDLPEWDRVETAEAFASWLRGRLGLPDSTKDSA